MKEKFKIAVLNGNFENALQYFYLLPIEEATDVLIDIAMSANILSYAFVCALIMQKECVEHHLIAVALNECACFMEGAYMLAFYHLTKIVQLSDDIKYLEHLLFYNDIPEKILNDRDAKKVTSVILKRDPANEIALSKYRELDETGDG